MKTTVEIPDALFREAKRYAADHELTLRELVEAALRKHLQAPARKPFRLKDASYRPSVPGMRKNFTWDQMLELSSREFEGLSDIDRD